MNDQNETIEQRIDRLAGSGFWVHLQLTESDEVIGTQLPQIPLGDQVIEVGERKFRALDVLRRRGPREVWMSATELKTLSTEQNGSPFEARINSWRTMPAPPPEPVVEPIRYRFEIRHRDQFLNGPKPDALFAISAIGFARIPSQQAEDQVTDELRQLCADLNLKLANAELTEFESRFIAVEASDRPWVGRDEECGTNFTARRIDALATGSRRPYSRRELLQRAPNLAAWLDELNGTAGQPIPLTLKQAEAKRIADEAADAASQQAAADEAEYAQATGAFLDAMSKKLPPRLRAANVAQCVKAFLDNPRLFQIAERDAAFLDATGKDRAEHGGEFTEQPAEGAAP